MLYGRHEDPHLRRALDVRRDRLDGGDERARRRPRRTHNLEAQLASARPRGARRRLGAAAHGEQVCELRVQRARAARVVFVLACE